MRCERVLETRVRRLGCLRTRRATSTTLPANPNRDLPTRGVAERPCVIERVRARSLPTRRPTRSFIVRLRDTAAGVIARLATGVGDGRVSSTEDRGEKLGSTERCTYGILVRLSVF